MGVDPLRDFEEVVREVEKVVRGELERNPEEVVAAPLPGDVDGNTGLVRIGEWNCVPGGWVGPKRRRGKVISTSEKEAEGAVEEEEEISGWDIPFYRCQPNFRPLPEEAVKRGAMSASALGNGQDADAKGADTEKKNEQTQRHSGKGLQKERQIDGDRGDGVKRVKVTE